MYLFFFKRIFDVLASFCLILLFAPLLIVIAILLIIENKSSPFFIQSRPGKNERKFEIIKFRSMNDKTDNYGNLLPDNERITVLGKIIRKWSLDELPQLINVLIGDMSLVGPRPLLFKYIPLFSESQRRRHEVKPGITGWAQVNGRNRITWSQKFNLDVYYVEHVSFCLDVKILWLTLIKVVKRDAVDQSDMRPMEPFNGFN